MRHVKVSISLPWGESGEMLKEAVGYIQEILKSPKLVAWVAITSALILYLPDHYGKAFLINFRGAYGTYIAVLLVASAAYLVIDVAVWVGAKLQKWKRRNEYAERLLSRLDELSYEEQIIMREFIFQGGHSIKLPIEHRVVSDLAREGLIQLVQRAPQYSVAGMVGVFRLNPIISRLLLEWKVGLPVGEVSEAERARIMDERPHFVHQILHRERTWEW